MGRKASKEARESEDTLFGRPIDKAGPGGVEALGRVWGERATARLKDNSVQTRRLVSATLLAGLTGSCFVPRTFAQDSAAPVVPPPFTPAPSPKFEPDAEYRQRRAALYFAEVDTDQSGVLDKYETMGFDGRMMKVCGEVINNPKQLEECWKQKPPIHNGHIWAYTKCRFEEDSE